MGRSHFIISVKEVVIFAMKKPRFMGAFQAYGPRFAMSMGVALNYGDNMKYAYATLVFSFSLIMLSACAKQFDSKQAPEAALQKQGQGQKPGQKGDQNAGQKPGEQRSQTGSTSPGKAADPSAEPAADSQAQNTPSADSGNSANNGQPDFSTVNGGSSSSAPTASGSASSGQAEPSANSQAQQQPATKNPLEVKPLDESKLDVAAMDVHNLLKKYRDSHPNDEIEECDVSIETGDGFLAATTITEILCDNRLELSDTTMDFGGNAKKIQAQVRQVVRYHLAQMGLACKQPQFQQKEDNGGMLNVLSIQCLFERPNTQQ